MRFYNISGSCVPETIDVDIDEGEIFSIGRFDASVGKKQSSFEFDKTQKMVSRRHAFIERISDVYIITDIASTYGTFIDGFRIPTNTPFPLELGTCVAFGNKSCEFIWEKCACELKEDEL